MKFDQAQYAWTLRDRVLIERATTQPAGERQNVLVEMEEMEKHLQKKNQRRRRRKVGWQAGSLERWMRRHASRSLKTWKTWCNGGASIRKELRVRGEQWQTNLWKKCWKSAK